MGLTLIPILARKEPESLPILKCPEVLPFNSWLFDQPIYEPVNPFMSKEVIRAKGIDTAERSIALFSHLLPKALELEFIGTKLKKVGNTRSRIVLFPSEASEKTLKAEMDLAKERLNIKEEDLRIRWPIIAGALDTDEASVIGERLEQVIDPDHPLKLVYGKPVQRKIAKHI